MEKQLENKQLKQQIIDKEIMRNRLKNPSSGNLAVREKSKEKILKGNSGFQLEQEVVSKENFFQNHQRYASNPKKNSISNTNFPSQ